MHNPKAGDEKSLKNELIRELERAGHEVAYYSTKGKKFARSLENPGDVVVIAGGDGTVRKVSLRLIGRNVPVAILPLGTANNIAKALGLEKSIKQIIRGLENARKLKFDIGIARGPWGDMPFFEATGTGIFPRMMARRAWHEQKGLKDAVDKHGGVRGGVHLLQEVLDGTCGREFAINVDGREISGKYLLIEAMNIPSIGPVLELAPNAKHGDGVLDVVIVKEEQRKELGRHLTGGVAKSNRKAFAVHRTRQLRLACSAGEFHFDDEVWPNPKENAGTAAARARNFNVEIEMFPGALRVLVPK